jgi:hypothetical protein
MLRNLDFNTSPSIVHAQGPHDYKPYWQPIRDHFFGTQQKKLATPTNLTIITWNNGHEAMGVFEKSIAHLGLDCVILGNGIENWVNSIHKPMLTNEALQNIKTEYILGVDSRDAILIDNPQLIIDQFLENFNCDLVFSADLLNWPNLAEFKKFEDKCAEGKNSAYRYLNSGAFIGRTSYCCHFFGESVKLQPVKQAERSDQGIFKQLFQTEYPKVQLDYHCIMFQNIGFVRHKSLEIS